MPGNEWLSFRRLVWENDHLDWRFSRHTTLLFHQVVVNTDDRFLNVPQSATIKWSFLCSRLDFLGQLIGSTKWRVAQFSVWVYCQQSSSQSSTQRDSITTTLAGMVGGSNKLSFTWNCDVRSSLSPITYGGEILWPSTHSATLVTTICFRLMELAGMTHCTHFSLPSFSVISHFRLIVYYWNVCSYLYFRFDIGKQKFVADTLLSKEHTHPIKINQQINNYKSINCDAKWEDLKSHGFWKSFLNLKSYWYREKHTSNQLSRAIAGLLQHVKSPMFIFIR